MLLRKTAVLSGQCRRAPRLGMGGLLLLVAALALTFPLAVLAGNSPSSAVGLGGPAAPEGARGPVLPTSWAAGAVYPSTIVRYAYAQSGQDLYVLGGVSDGTRVSAANRYNATTNAWTPLAPVPVASEAPTAALLDGKIYLAEGDTGDSLNIYDIATNTWSSGAPRPGYTNNYGAAAGAFGGKVYVVGGSAGGTDTTSVYTVATNSWTTGAPAPVGFFLAGYTTVGQYLYVVGGFTSASPSSNSNVTMRLDMSTGTWTVGPTYTPARADEGIASSGNTLYALGGDTPGGAFFDSSSAVDSLDVSAWPSGSWTSVADPLPTARQANEGGFFS